MIVEACHIDFKKYIFRDNGTIISLGHNYKNKKLKGGTAGQYKMVNLYRNDGKRIGMTFHMIIAEVFLGIRPKGLVIDHKNNKKHDNRLINLHYVTPAENTAKKRSKLGKRNKSGIRGVFFSNADERWIASIYKHSKIVYRRSFFTKEDAAKARLNAEKKYWGDYKTC